MEKKLLILILLFFLSVFSLVFLFRSVTRTKITTKSKAALHPDVEQGYSKAFFWIRSMDTGKPMPTPGVHKAYDGIIEIFWDEIGNYNFDKIEQRIAATSVTNTFYDGSTSPRKYAIKVMGSYWTATGPKARVPAPYLKRVTCPTSAEVGEYPAYDDPAMLNAWNVLTEKLAEKYNNDERINAIIFGLGMDGEARAAKSTANCDWYQWSLNTGFHETYIRNFLGAQSSLDYMGTIKKHRDAFTNKVTYWPLAIQPYNYRRRILDYMERIQTNPPRIGYMSNGLDWEVPLAHISTQQPYPTPWIKNTRYAGFMDWYVEHPDWPSGGENKAPIYQDTNYYWMVLAALRYNLDFFDAYWYVGSTPFQARAENIPWLPELSQRSGKKQPKDSTNVWIAFHDTKYTSQYFNAGCPDDNAPCLRDNSCSGIVSDHTYGLVRSVEDLSPLATGSRSNICNLNFGYEEMPFAGASFGKLPGLMSRRTADNHYINLNIIDDWRYKNTGLYTVKVIMLNNYTTPRQNNNLAKLEYYDVGGRQQTLDLVKDQSKPEIELPWIIKEFRNIRMRFNNDFGSGVDFRLSDAGDGPDYFHMVWLINQGSEQPPGPTATLAPTRPPGLPTNTPTPTLTPPAGTTSTPTPSPSRSPLTPTITATPTSTSTVTPSPTLAPSPTQAQQPPRSQNVAVTIRLKLKFQGILKKPKDEFNQMDVKISVVKEGEAQGGFILGDFKSDEFGVWWGLPIGINPLDITAKYKIYIKGPKHLQKKICDQNPTESWPGTYSCSQGEITFHEGENDLDFSNILLLVGDLPDQDGLVTSYDTSLIFNNFGKIDIETLRLADVNLDGVVDTQDYSLVIGALSVKADEK